MTNASHIGKSWVIVCQHLQAKPHQHWNDVTNADGVTEGHLCDACIEIGPQAVPIKSLEPMAVESVNLLRRPRQ
jgi:hypothetical protein